MLQKNENNKHNTYLNATGHIAVNLRNDMMFHRVMQKSNKALKGLVCALKGLDPNDVSEVILTNPMDYSEYAHKEIILDVKILLNNREILDIELQMYNDDNWERRSLLYLCRSFDSIGEGRPYSDLKQTSLIAILDQPLRPDFPEFYSKYRLLNLENHMPYSTLLNLNVLYLSQTDLATDDDIKNNLVYWAQLFKANSWEELKGISKKRPEFEEVAKIMYNVNIQDSERTLYEAHQRFLLEQRSIQANIEEAKQELEVSQRQLEDSRKQLEDSQKQLEDSQKQLEDSQKQLEDSQKQLEDSNAQRDKLSAENAHLKKLLAEAGLLKD